MCGIVGYFSAKPLERGAGQRLVDVMAAALVHRGPDQIGSFVSPHCGLGATRLAIVDPANGRMPVGSEDGRIACVMNGEIYNFAELRRGLIVHGHELRTRGDSEVIPHLYEEHGESFVRQLTGMFAIALWDDRTNELVLARDRFGIKPLFVAPRCEPVLFASEAKAILATGLVSRRIDIGALMDLGTAGYPMPTSTMFEAIESVAPASAWTFGLGRAARSTVYFRVPYPVAGSTESTPVADAAVRVRDLFDGVVRDHLTGDVTIGALVSGGLDSVSVAATASQFMSAPIRSFSMTFPESAFSDRAADAFGAQHVRVVQGRIDEPVYRATIRAMEAPQLSTVPFCTYRLARTIHDHGLKVVLSGEGADEVFAGYSTFRRSKTRRDQDPSDLQRQRSESRNVLDPELFKLYDAWWQLEPSLRRRYGVVPPSGENWWLLGDAWWTAIHPDLGRASERHGPSLERLPRNPPNPDGDLLHHELHRELRFEQRTRLDGWVLAMSDRVAMANSVEVRVPFLDHRLVELTATMPPEVLLNGYHEKHILRESMRGRIPEALRQRTKRGFAAPVQEWLFDADAPAYVAEALAPDVIRERGVFSVAGVEALRRRLQPETPAPRRISAAGALNLVVGVHIFMDEFSAAL
jgi:asparagine synthase (glutamine-hydrolysing)